MRPVTRRATGDTGTAIVLMALTLTVLLVFVAFAVDLGMIANERKKAQNGADAGALAGGRLLLEDAAENAIVDEVIEVTHANVASAISLTDWRNRFATDCQDPDRNPTEYPRVSAFSACISFNAFMTRVRVQLPITHAPTSFAQIIGIDELQTRAFAEAEIVSEGGAGVLPFGLVGDPGAGTEVCLKTGQSPDDPPTVAPCNGPVTGNFGWLDIAWYGNPTMGTTEACTGQTQTRMAVNIARGADHLLDEYRGPEESPAEPAEAVRNDRDHCPDLGARPNELLDQDGSGSALDAGLISGTTLDGRPIPGRLALGPYTTDRARAGVNLDDAPLWQFIDPALTAGVIPATCVAGTISNKAQMSTCLQDYAAGGYSIPLFSRDANNDGVIDIVRSPRLGMVPEFYATAFTTDAQHKYKIERFRMVFIQTTFFSCNPGGCDGVFDPGEAGFGLRIAANKKVEALTSLLLPMATLPTSVLAIIGPNAIVPETLILRK